MRTRDFLRKNKEGEPGVWVNPKRKYYFSACCDCGLVHRMEFRIVPTFGGKDGKSGRAIQFRLWRDERKTKALRRQMKQKHGSEARDESSRA